ncbi:MAG TPA: hypothetical protein VGD86_03640, partial [Devosia sp.]
MALTSLGLAPLLAPAVATDGVQPVATSAIDQVVTGSVSETVKAAPSTASAAFKAALGLVASGDYAEAYDAAKTLPSDAERRAVQWAAIYFGGGKVDYTAVLRFSADAPAFASTPVFKTRLEQALTKAGPDPKTVIKVLGGAMPNTIDAQIALAEAYVAEGNTKRAASIARTIWVENFLDRGSEGKVLRKLGELLTPADHWDRAVHLMMHDRAAAVERLMTFMTPAQQSLATARNATSRNAKNAK